MGRPLKARSVFAEEFARRRVKMERERRGWSPEALAKRMADAGCPIPTSAIYKIESDERRITVDELAVLAQLFDLGIAQMISDPHLTLTRDVAELVEQMWLQLAIHAEAAQLAAEAGDAASELNRRIAVLIAGNSEAQEELLGIWNEHVGDALWFKEKREQARATMPRRRKVGR